MHWRWVDKVLMGVCFVLVFFHVLYLSERGLRELHGVLADEVDVGTPVVCEDRDLDLLEGGGTGGVFFHVDMRCSGGLGSGDGSMIGEGGVVYVTGPFCGGCGPEGWNELSDVDGDGIWSREILFVGSGDFGLAYRYGIGVVGGEGVFEGEGVVGGEGVFEEEVLSGGCAPVSDSLGGLRVLGGVLGETVWDVYGVCGGDEVTLAELEARAHGAYMRLNPRMGVWVDPWYGLLLRGLQGVLIFDPVLFLSVCSAFYVVTMLVAGLWYTQQTEGRIRHALDEAVRVNTYLEHAAKILRHDMHSGINTYIPRGLSSVERRLEKRPDVVDELKLGPPLRMLRDGLVHTQRVYAGVTEFTNLVKGQGRKIERKPHDLREILLTYLETMAYRDQVVIDRLPVVHVNEPLFCTAVDNLIRNGLKYNDSAKRMVVIRMLDLEHLAVIDNGRGLTQAEFDQYSKPYARRQDQKEKGTGLGLNICVAIFQEHGFPIWCIKNDPGPGTTIKIKIL